MNRMILILPIVPLFLAACAAGTPRYLVDEKPTAILSIGHQDSQTWHRELFDLYLLEVGDGCLHKTRVPISTAKHSSRRNRTAPIPAAADVTFVLEHDSPYENVHYECNVLFSVNTEQDLEYRLTFLQSPDFSVCGVAFERLTAKGGYRPVPAELLAQQSVEEGELPTCR